MTQRPFILLLFACLSLPAVAQSDPASTSDTTYVLTGNTLSSNHNFSITVGQPIIVGKGSGEQGWYRTIMFRNSTAWPILLLRDQELEQNVEYKLDESIRERDKVRDYLSPGDTLTVTKIKQYGKKRSGNTWYVVWMRSNQGALSLNFKCYIIEAIRRGEVVGE